MITKILNWYVDNLIFAITATYIISIPFYYKEEFLKTNSFLVGSFIICFYCLSILEDNLRKRTETLKEMKETLDRMKEKLDEQNRI